MTPKSPTHEPSPHEGGAAEQLETERASATPTPPAPAEPRRRRAPPPPRSLPLGDAQAWFFHAIAHPDTSFSGSRSARLKYQVSIDELLTSTPTLDASSRLGVYHFAYRSRLIEALADDFPALRHALGSDRFEALADQVVRRFPSRGPNLNAFGYAMVRYLEGKWGRIAGRPFLRDLARLEWALVEVVHAAVPPRLSPAALRAIPPESWPGLRFRGSPSLRLLTSRWPTNRYLQAFRQGAAPPFPSPERSATLVYRQGFTVWRMDLSPLTHRLLTDLLHGDSLGTALAAVEGRAGSEQVMRWFEAWVSGGVFSGVD